MAGVDHANDHHPGDDTYGDAKSMLPSLLLDGTTTSSEKTVRSCGDATSSLSDVSELLRDLELFSNSRDQDNEDGLFSGMATPHISMRSCGAPMALLKEMIATPSGDATLLERRQRWLLSKAKRLVTIHDASVINAEADMLWAWRFITSPDEDVVALHRSAYFSSWLIGNWLNKSSACIAANNMYRIYAAPVIGALTPLLYVIVPYIMLRFKFKIRIGLTAFLKMMYSIVSAQLRNLSGARQHITQYVSIGVSLVFYFQGVFSSMQVSRMLHGVCSGVTQRVSAIRLFARNTLEAWEGIGDASSWAEAAACWTGPQFAWCDPDVLPCERALATSVSQGQLINRYGGDLEFFQRSVIGSREAISCVLRRAYVMDALGAVMRMVGSLSLAPVEFLHSPSPELKMTGLWHPGVKGAVPNDWSFSPSERNAILTGPNAGGKSTLMKSTLLSVLMAQTLSFVPCKSMQIRPFGALCSHINVPDSHVRGESLFQAEMNRAKRCVLSIEQARKRGLTCLVVIDEIFSSTNPVEGIAGAVATASKIGSFDNAINIVSTHFTHLAKLARGPEPCYRAFKMPVKVDKQTGAITSEYKLHRGVSTQYVALEIMRASDMDSDIVREAIRVKEELLQAASRKQKPEPELSTTSEKKTPHDPQTPPSSPRHSLSDLTVSSP